MSKLPITIEEIPLGPAKVRPGEILEEEFLKPLALSQAALAGGMGVDRMLISEIVRGRRAITARTAILLGLVLNTTAEFWLGLQNDHDLAVAALELQNDSSDRPAFAPRVPKTLVSAPAKKRMDKLAVRDALAKGTPGRGTRKSDGQPMDHVVSRRGKTKIPNTF